mmetsp:Transcript_55738/g.147244  ORF Transcript_55738/g.147244 Transcript_55738/m.147244 type:complete len:176 (-) Transcript_55738:116-643(-)
MDLPMFEGSKSPISPSAYIKRIVKYGGLSPCCFVVGLIYLERLKRQEPTVCLTSNSFQRLILVAVMLAAKYLDDFYYSNKRWAEIGGISTREINMLELEFLFRLEFSVGITREEYDWHAGQLLLNEGMVPPPQEELPALGRCKLLEGPKFPSCSNIADASSFFDAPDYAENAMAE